MKNKNLKISLAAIILVALVLSLSLGATAFAAAQDEEVLDDVLLADVLDEAIVEDEASVADEALIEDAPDFELLADVGSVVKDVFVSHLAGVTLVDVQTTTDDAIITLILTASNTPVLGVRQADDAKEWRFAIDGTLRYQSDFTIFIS